MKQETSFLKRCLALVLALVLLVSNMNLGALRVFAAEVTKTAGEIVAENYDLTDAEKALLASGNLAGEGVDNHTTLDPSKITVDTEMRIITAEDQGNWVPHTAVIKVGDAVVETIDVIGNEAYYTYDGNAFSVVVNYVLYVEVDFDLQETLLKTSGWLKEGVALTDAVSAQGGNLYILEQAMPELVNFANNGVTTPLGTVTFPDEVRDQVNDLNAQMTANSGKLNLSVMVEDYDAGAKTGYLLIEGAAMKAELDTFVPAVEGINKGMQTMVDNLAIFIQNGWVSADLGNQLKTLAGVCANLVTGLSDAKAAKWTAAEKGTALVSGSVNYAELDVLVANLGDITPLSYMDNPLVAGRESVQVNMAMFNVAVNVELKVVENEIGSTDLVTHGTKTVTLTLGENATAADILAAVAASGIVADANAAWGEAFVAEQFNENTSALPEALVEDITYTITYTPKEYTLTEEYGATLTVPYGYQYKLPVHDNPEQAYDYKVNGESKAQGEVIVIKGDTTIERTSGKAYTSKNLYEIVADNYGNDLAKDILKSGALKDDVAINVRKPDPADSESLLTLKDGKLSAKDYDAAYYGLKWNPYTFSANGNEYSFPGNEADCTAKEAKVIYKLVLSNFSVAEVQAILGMASALKEEADEQTKTLDRLAAYHSTMGQLDKTKLGALNGVIDVQDSLSAEMKNYFKTQVSGIINENLEGNNLRIFNILGAYLDETNGGLYYYYKNSAAVIAEIDSLSARLSAMLADEAKVEALETLVGAAGYPEYADKIKDLEGIMASVKAALTAPNAKIDLSSANLKELTNALETDGTVISQTASNPYLLSDELTVADESQVYVQVIVAVGSDSATITTAAMDRGAVLTQAVVDQLKADVAAKVATMVKESVDFYNVEVVGTPIENLVGTELDAIQNIYYTYTAKAYTVKIDGVADQNVTIDKLIITLPKHPTKGWSYTYHIGDKAVVIAETATEDGIYAFTAEELKNLFVDGTYTITRTERNVAQDQLEDAFEEWLVEDAEGNVIGLHANVDGNKDGIMGFAMTLVNSGYTYIGLNGEDLLYLNAEDTLEIRMQTLINAIMKDEKFSNDTLINLGKNGEGEFLHAEISLGNSKDDIHYTDLDFVLYLTSAPAQVATVGKGMEAMIIQGKSLVEFRGNKSGAMDITLNLPEKIYEAYLVALLASKQVEKDDIAAIESEIAMMFLWDYIEVILATDANTQTLTNNLAMLGIDKDLTAAEDYFQLLKRLLKNPGVVVNSEKEGFDVSLAAKGQSAIDKLINFIGVDTSSFDTYLGMVKEYKNNDELVAAANVELGNTETSFEALLLDIEMLKDLARSRSAKAVLQNADGFDFTTDLEARVADIAGQSAIMLLSDVTGDLHFKGHTILDLNGYTLNGNITVENGTVYIVDSRMGTFKAGSVTGSIPANATVFGGKFNADVSAKTYSGYVQNADGYVHNVLFTITDEDNTYTVNVNTDFLEEGELTYIEFAKAVAADLTIDMILNYYTAAALSAEGNELYNVNFDDLFGLLANTNKLDNLIQKVLNSINVPGMADFMNVVLEDILDFAAIEAAAAGDHIFANYALTTAPWKVSVEHMTEEDYLTFSIVSNDELAETFNVALKLDGSKVAYVEKLAGALADVVTASVVLTADKPEYDFDTNKLTANGGATIDFTFDIVNVDEDLRKDYLTVIAVVMGYSDTAKRTAWKSAINDMDEAALKALVDGTTVQGIIKALKKLSRNVNFASMAQTVGVTDYESAADLEGIFHLILCASGKALEHFDITGPASDLGGTDSEVPGTYKYSKSLKRSLEKGIRSYSVLVTGEATANITLVLFGELEHEHEIEIIPGKEATCTEDGLTEGQKCSICGEIIVAQEVIPALGHDEVIVPAKDATCTESGLTEGKYCARCGEILATQEIIPALGYAWDEGVVTKNPTCTEEGEITYTCTNGCNHTKTEKLPMVDHEGEWVVVKAPTCIEDGLRKLTCTVCGETIEEVIDKSEGHDVAEWTVTKEPTCTEPGEETGYCSKCEQNVTREIPMIDHDYERVQVAPDCENAGYVGLKCSVCGDLIIESEQAPLGHEFIKQTKEATCTEEGYVKNVCIRCEHEELVETIPVLPHTPGNVIVENLKEADCENDGHYDNVTYCTVCGYECSRETVVVPALGHTEGDVVVENEVAADCENAGSYDNVVYCSVCNEELSRETVVVPALGHKAAEAVKENEVAADCVNPGSYDEVIYCSVCNEELSRVTKEVPALGHTEGDVVVENEVAADCVNDGSYDNVVYCSVCNEELSRETVIVPALGHTEGDVVVENEVAADCENDGSYDNVVYCSVCGEELSRETVIVPALGHTEGQVVVENNVPADCENDGSYDNVTYCTICGEELSRETVTVPALGHDFGDWYVSKEAHCICEDGEERRDCKNCDHYETRVIESTGLWGDANHDGIVDTRDALLVQQMWAGVLGNKFCCDKCTDVNADGVVDTRDALLIQQKWAGVITKFEKVED